jgi:hypothetical protein
MTDPVRPTGMLELNATPRIDTHATRRRFFYSGDSAIIRDLCDEIDILRGELASAEFAIRRRECLDALKAAIEKAKTIEGHAHG